MNANRLNTEISPERRKLMERLGIRHVLTDLFTYRDYRYGKLDDAVAQAMRDQEAASGEKQP